MSSTPKENSSSSGIVFAKPTKQWVIPERAKPGRKAKVKVEPTNTKSTKSSTSIPTSTPSPSSPSSPSDVIITSSITTESPNQTTTSSSVQTNREAQRNFRLRKSSYIASLETRIAAFERGEFERSKELQTSALAVKEENEVLKKENRRLRSEVGVLRSEIRRVGNEVERLRGSKPTPSMAKKRVETPKNITPITPPSDNIDSLIQRDRRESINNNNIISNDRRPSLPSRIVPISPTTFRTDNKDSILPCGFCTDVETVCVCRMVAEAENGITTSMEVVDTDMENSQSILDMLPPPEPAVPLPRRERKKVTSGGMPGGLSWWITSNGDSSTLNEDKETTFGVEIPVVDLSKYSGLINLAQCSGDPKNCDACRDDDFGRQFCERLTNTVCADSSSGERCSRCTNNTNSSPSLPSTDAFMSNAFNSNAFINSHSATHIEAPCCGDGEICGRKPTSCKGHLTPETTAFTLPSIADALENVARLESPVEAGSRGHGETMGADEAWRTLKAHPNAQYASLDMLADVVARRTKCYGPRVELSPPPPETAGEAAPLRQLVPLDELVVTHSKRRLEVQADGVRDALALLDAQPRKRMKMTSSAESSV